MQSDILTLKRVKSLPWTVQRVFAGFDYALGMNTTDRIRNKFYLFSRLISNCEVVDSHTINHPVKYFYHRYSSKIIVLADPSFANKIFVYNII